MIKEYKKDNDFTVFQCFNKQDVSCQLGGNVKKASINIKFAREINSITTKSKSK